MSRHHLLHPCRARHALPFWHLKRVKEKKLTGAAEMQSICPLDLGFSKAWEGGPGVREEEGAQLAGRSPNKGACQSMAWTTKRGYILLLYCWHELPGTSKQSRRLLDDQVAESTGARSAMLSGTLAAVYWVYTACLICFRTPQHRHIFSTVHARVEACSRPSLLWSASSGWWAHLQGLHEQWDGSGSWICAGTLSLASSHWHTFVLGKCPTGMFQGDAALYVRTASAIYPAAWLVCLSNQPQARGAPAGLSATLISIAAGWRDA